MPLLIADTTGYCDHGTMASGQYTHWGAVASNRHPLGTKIKLSRRVDGRRYFRVLDRIGWGSELDIWFPSCDRAVRFGRRTVRYRVVPRRRTVLRMRWLLWR